MSWIRYGLINCSGLPWYPGQQTVKRVPEAVEQPWSKFPQSNIGGLGNSFIKSCKQRSLQNCLLHLVLGKKGLVLGKQQGWWMVCLSFPGSRGKRQENPQSDKDNDPGTSSVTCARKEDWYPLESFVTNSRHCWGQNARMTTSKKLIFIPRATGRSVRAHSGTQRVLGRSHKPNCQP